MIIAVALNFKMVTSRFSIVTEEVINAIVENLTPKRNKDTIKLV